MFIKKTLTTLAEPSIEQLKQLLPKDAHVLLLDENGYILDDKSGFNSNLSLQEYLSANKNYTRSQSYPMIDSRDKMIGYLALLSADDADSLAHSLLRFTAKAIEKEYINQSLTQTVSKMNHEVTALLESIPVGAIVTDKDMIIRRANAGIQKLLGIQVELMLGKHIDVFLHSNEFFDRLFKNKMNIYDKDMTFTSLKGKISCGVSVTLIEGTDSNFEGMVIKLKSTKYMYRFLDTSNDASADFKFENIKGSSKETKEVIRISQIAAKSNSSVLLIGESGTGKELFAQAIHNHSERKNNPFVAINCGAFPRGLIESELFGYEGGAFTGSKKDGQLGKFELAEGGTLFLDEIGDMPVDVQVSLLRVLQNKEIVRVGGNRIVKVDVRIIAATNRDVEKAIINNTFRSDLYYRLNVFSINIPPLRARRDDILTLAEFFIQKHAHYLNKEIKVLDSNVQRVLLEHHWPGNIRELENTIERAMNISENNVISMEDLPEYMRNADCFDIYDGPLEDKDILDLDQLEKAEKQVIIETLKELNGNLSAVAQSIGISRKALYRRLDKYGIYPGIYRSN